MTCSDALCATFSAIDMKDHGKCVERDVTIVVCEHEQPTHTYILTCTNTNRYKCNNDVKLCCKYKVRCLCLPLHPAITPNYFPG